MNDLEKLSWIIAVCLLSFIVVMMGAIIAALQNISRYLIELVDIFHEEK